LGWILTLKEDNFLNKNNVLSVEAELPKNIYRIAIMMPI